MDEFTGVRGGLFAALKNSAATLLASGKTRLELLSNEIEEEKLRAVQMLTMAIGAALCLGVGILMLILFMTALFWESRLLVLGGSTALLLVAGWWFYAGFRSAQQRPDRMFAASIAELEEDLRQLKASLGHDATPE